MTAPRQTTAAYLRPSASRWATTGISNDPGTRTTSTASSATPWRRKASSAPASRASTTTALKRAATTAKRPGGVAKSPSMTVAMWFGSPHPGFAEHEEQHAEREAEDCSDDRADTGFGNGHADRGADHGHHQRCGVDSLRLRRGNGGFGPTEEVRQVLASVDPAALLASDEAVAL